jgi:hypothetical protein
VTGLRPGATLVAVAAKLHPSQAPENELSDAICIRSIKMGVGSSTSILGDGYMDTFATQKWHCPQAILHSGSLRAVSRMHDKPCDSVTKYCQLVGQGVHLHVRGLSMENWPKGMCVECSKRHSMHVCVDYVDSLRPGLGGGGCGCRTKFPDVTWVCGTPTWMGDCSGRHGEMESNWEITWQDLNLP